MAKQDKKPAAPELETEVASRLHDPYENTFLGVVQTNDPLLMEKGDPNGEIYRDLKRDGKVFSCLQKRKHALIGAEIQVVPVVEGEAGLKDAEIVSGILKRCAFDQVCMDLLDALLRGFAVSEIVWTVRDGYYVPERIVKRAQRRFRYVLDEAGIPRLRMLTRESMTTGVELPDRKFIVHRVSPEDDNPYGTGLGLQLFWAVFFKRKGLVSWNKLNDRFGTPTAWGKHPRNASPKEKATLFSALKALSNDGVIVTPEGSAIELIESKLTGSVTTQQALCESMDDWIAEVVLGQEPRRGGGGGAMAAASKERTSVRLDLVQADSDLLSNTLNESLIKWICELNGLAMCQVSREVAEEEDKKAESETDKNVSEMGFELSEEAVREKYGEGWSKKAPPPAPTPPAAPPVPGQKPDPAAAAGNPAGAGDLANFAEGGGPDGIDALVDEAMGGWKPMMQPFSTVLQAELDASAAAGETAGEFIARLPALLAKMDPAALQEALTNATSTAHLAGLSGVENA